MSYAKNLFPVLQDIPFKVGYTDDENDLVYARSDMELKEAYSFFKTSNEIKLTIHSDSTEPITTSGVKKDLSLNSSPMPKQPFISLSVDSSYPIDDTDFQNSRVHLKELIIDLLKAKENFITFNTKNGNILEQKMNWIKAEKQRVINLELELQQAQETFSSAGLELSNHKESLKKIGTQLQLKLKEISDLKKDREEKLRLKSQLDELDGKLNGKIEENLTMSKTLHTLTIERDHFNKKATELEHRQKTLEFELSASQFGNMVISPVLPVSNYKTPSSPINPILNGGTPSLGFNSPPTVIPVVNLSPSTNPSHPISPPQPTVPKYDFDHPPPDISMELIHLIIGMGIDDMPPDVLFALLRKHNYDIQRTINEYYEKKERG